MPIYIYSCPRHGKFEIIRGDFKKHIPCVECGLTSHSVISIPYRTRVEHKENLPLGNKSRGRFIPPDGNRSGILVPSFGALEKEEVDYIAEASLEKERNRVRKSEQKDALENVTKALLSSPQGKRHETLNKILGGS